MEKDKIEELGRMFAEVIDLYSKTRLNREEAAISQQIESKLNYIASSIKYEPQRDLEDYVNASLSLGLTLCNRFGINSTETMRDIKKRMKQYEKMLK